MRSRRCIRPRAGLALALFLPWCVTATLLHSLAASTAARVQDITVASQALGRDVRVRVLLPRGYAGSQRHYPVLYLLHGLYGDFTNWETFTELESYTRDLPLILVMPDAGNSWYVNSATTPANKFEDFLTVDVLPAIERRYRVLAVRDHRAIAGLSMGGYGALKYGLKHPELFVIAGSFSGALNAPRDLADQEPRFAPYLNPVFGARDSSARSANDLFRLITGLAPQFAPYLYLDCGTHDPYFIPVNRAFVAALHAGNFTYEYHETPGAHDWQYWNQRISFFLHLLIARGSVRPD